MRKMIIGVVFCILMIGCQGYVDDSNKTVNPVIYNGITHGYSSGDAIVNGDVVTKESETFNLLELDNFILSVKEGIETSIQITKCVNETVPVINVLECIDGKIECTAYQKNDVLYDEITVNETLEHIEYVLSNCYESVVILKSV
ncbi:MAG: DUF4362 domain-containing protein [Clostridiales bacterium]|nr:DUF4362 domain-containing protein [Clostridiales bacterium]